MTRSGLLVCICAGIISVTLAGCNHQAQGSSTTSTSAVSSVAGPAKPAATADDNTWGNYLAEQGKIHGKDIGMHPYIYVIPAGDSVAANTRRKEESDSIRHSVGPILMPGGLLIMGGPDSPQTSGFIASLTKDMKPDTFKGIVVLVVSDAAQEAPVTDALKPTGATVRFVAM